MLKERIKNGNKDEYSQNLLQTAITGLNLSSSSTRLSGGRTLTSYDVHLCYI
jgi:hypothetical protein